LQPTAIRPTAEREIKRLLYLASDHAFLIEKKNQSFSSMGTTALEMIGIS
jgi:hypothetical protein